MSNKHEARNLHNNQSLYAVCSIYNYLFMIWLFPCNSISCEMLWFFSGKMAYDDRNINMTMVIVLNWRVHFIKLQITRIRWNSSSCYYYATSRHYFFGLNPCCAITFCCFLPSLFLLCSVQGRNTNRLVFLMQMWTN